MAGSSTDDFRLAPITEIDIQLGDPVPGKLTSIADRPTLSPDHVSETDWEDWHWQMSNRVSSAAALSQFVDLTEPEASALSSSGTLFRVDVTPYFASLMSRTDAMCPIRRQVIPLPEEATLLPGDSRDPLSEEKSTPQGASRILHRYPDRAVLIVHTECASYCRFCTRSRIVGKPLNENLSVGILRGIEYLREHTQIRDVLLTGGDPLLLGDQAIDDLLSRLRELKHIEILRMSTRLPVFLPQRITPTLVRTLRKYAPFWLNVNINHPRELTPRCRAALDLLADGGIPLGSQTVLMAGINDCPNIIKSLMHQLLISRVRPYYLYQCDLTAGTAHFRTPVAKGIEVMESLRGHTSGLAVPTFVIDAPDGGGKTPIAPQYLISSSERAVILRTYEGRIIAYPETHQYHQHNPNACEYCSNGVKEPTPSVAALL